MDLYGKRRNWAEAIFEEDFPILVKDTNTETKNPSNLNEDK